MLNLRTGKNDLAPMSRRDFGKGIAAILATGCAPWVANARMVRSMAAARTACWTGGWKNPYITDGLIAMWDGEWNVGGGKHEANATVWKDLIGNNDWNVLSGGSWGEKTLNGNGECAATRGNYTGFSSAPVTVSYVFSSNATATHNVVVLHIKDWCASNTRNMYRCIIRRGETIGFMSNGDNNPYALLSSLTTTLSAVTVVYDGLDVVKEIYLNGEKAELVNQDDNWFANDATLNCIGNRPTGGRGGVFSFGSIRYYSSELTEAEIRNDYAVDKARFGIT